MQLKTIANKVGYRTKQASPYILFGVGLVTFGGTIAAAIKATMKLEPILDAHRIERASIKESISKAEGLAEDATELANLPKVEKKEVRKLYFHTIGKIGRLYAPTAALGALSVGSFTASAGILRGRYLMACGALERVTEAFEDYRHRVVEDAGEEKDLEYYYGLEPSKEVVGEETDENGKTKKVKKNVLKGDPTGLFAYRFKKFDGRDNSGSTQWDESPVYNYTYIMGIVSQCQNQLDAGMTVYLDRVLDQLGFSSDDKSEHMAGWLPGDHITCGLEDDDDGTIIFDSLRYKYGNNPDVTLRFNPRINVFAKGKEKEDVTTDISEEVIENE